MLTWRKLSALVPQLPAESATATALRLDGAKGDAEQAPADPEAEQWSRMEQILAAIRDELHTLRWLYTSRHSAKGKGPKWRPEPLARPGVVSKRKARLAPEQAAVLAAHLARTQGGNAAYN